MTLFDVVLFLHVAVLLAAFFLGGALHAAEYQIGSVRSVQDLKVVTRPFRFGALFAPLVVLLFLLGMWLVELSKDGDEVFHVKEAWVWTAIVAVVILLLDGALVMGRHGAALGKALAAAPDGPVPPALGELATEPVTWMTSHLNTLMVLGVVLNMVTKPDTLLSVVDVVGGAAVGLVVGSVMSRRARGALVAA